MYQRNQLLILKQRIKEPRKFIQVLLGPRQTGKTTIVRQLVQEIKTPYHFALADEANESSIGWIDQQWETARILLKTSGSNEILLIIDEIQKIKDWSNAVKYHWDKDTLEKLNIKVILLGSAKIIIQKGLSESLTGRFEVIPVLHWSYNEMQQAFGFSFEQYVWFGAYPGAAFLINDENRWKDYIRNSIIETTISKDILMITRIDKPALLKRLFELSCNYSGQILSFTKMLGQLDDAGNSTTLSHYLNLLDTVGLVSGLEKYSIESFRQKASSPKLQVQNPCLISALSPRQFKESFENSAIWGRHVESAVGAYLSNVSKQSDIKLFYWRHRNYEVDFVIQKDDKIIGIEVKSGKLHKPYGIDEFKKVFNPYKIILVGKSGIPIESFLKMDLNVLFE
ncbi:MAG: ATP-binding protein [Saprospiraceae bacterium]|nr:ATP-binding protein [Saprospiraceae bacterium]